MLVSMKSPGSWMERSTWLSAAKLIRHAVVTGPKGVQPGSGRKCHSVQRCATDGPEDGQGFEIVCIGKFVEVHHRLIAAGDPVKYKIAADEAGAPCDEDADSK